MTTPTRPEPWGDDRLAAAFAARAALAVTPVDLAGATSAALRTRSNPDVVWPRLLAPAAVVVLAIGAVFGGLALSGRGGTPESPGGPPPDPGTFPTPVSSEAAGLPVISVRDAIALRDAGPDDREAAVRGWFAPLMPVPCPFTPATSPVQPVCPDDQIILMADPEWLVTPDGNGYRRASPTGPSFQIDIDDLDGGWQPGLPIIASTPPVEIVIVGHFDDRRSASCPVEVQAACRDRFVVDRVDSADGRVQPTSKVEQVEGGGTPFDDAWHIVEAVRPGVAILSAVHVDGADGLRRIEPALAAQGSDLLGERAVWVMRVLDGEAMATYAVADSTGSLYEFTADGAVLVALSAPGDRTSPSPIRQAASRPSPAWGPWPPPNAFSVLEFKDDAGRKPRVAVVDDSRLLEWIQEGVPDPAIGAAGSEGLFRDPSGVHRYRLRWGTTICDREMIVTVAADVKRIVIEHAPRDGCDAMYVGRELVLQFSRDVEPDDVGLEVIPATLLPE